MKNGKPSASRSGRDRRMDDGLLAARGPAAWEVAVGDRRLPLTDFLLRCARSLADGQPAQDGAFVDARDAFLAGGMAALRAAPRRSSWVQVGVGVRRRPPDPELYRRLAATARELLEQPTVGNFFFMHKPPGLRVRFETAGPGRHRLEHDLHRRLAAWQAEGLVEQVVPAVYEPETHLFGGRVSMRSVHRLFTADALAWLDYHALARERGGPAWALSLLMLRALFDALEIVGWEDLDVWDRIRRKTGRRLAEQARGHTVLARAADGIRAGWAAGDRLLEQLPPRARQIAATFQQAVAPEAARWRAEYFATRQAAIGPRQAAAYLTIFHWNRAGLPLLRQALLTEALVDRQAG
jgi:thiopeptide-type bacteriocin biosynthesis protein